MAPTTRLRWSLKSWELSPGNFCEFCFTLDTHLVFLSFLNPTTHHLLPPPTFHHLFLSSRSIPADATISHLPPLPLPSRSPCLHVLTRAQEHHGGRCSVPSPLCSLANDQGLGSRADPCCPPKSSRCARPPSLGEKKDKFSRCPREYLHCKKKWIFFFWRHNSLILLIRRTFPRGGDEVSRVQPRYYI